MIGYARQVIQAVRSKINEIGEVIRAVRAVINDEKNKNIANYLTFGRIYAIPVIIFLIIEEITVSAGILFIAASITDYADGYIAQFWPKVWVAGHVDYVMEKLTELQG